jgi:hypothetical protein
MSFVDAFIADLDSMIAERGQEVRLQRLTTGPEGQSIAFEAVFRANVRAAAPTDLVEPGARETVVVISPTDLEASRFPGLPRRDDRIIIAGDPMAVVEIAPVYVEDRLARVRLSCRG